MTDGVPANAGVMPREDEYSVSRAKMFQTTRDSLAPVLTGRRLSRILTLDKSRTRPMFRAFPVIWAARWKLSRWALDTSKQAHRSVVFCRRAGSLSRDGLPRERRTFLLPGRLCVWRREVEQVL